jgi:glycosyltransferase involved in cell wall biosynthesis
MEVAFFTDSYLPIADGVAVEAHALARALRGLGHGVTVYTTHPVVGAPTREEMIDGVSVVRCRSLPVPVYGQYRWPIFPFGSFAGRHLDRSTDIIHLHTPGMIGTAGFLAARRFQRPLVGTFHTDVYAARDSFGPNRWLKLFFWVAQWYSLGVYYRCDLTTAPSSPARASLLSHASKPFRRDVEIVPNGVETGRFRPGVGVPDWRARCGFGSEPLLTFLGRLTVDKGVHRFLDALAALPPGSEWSALVAGIGPEEALVRARLASDPHLRGRVRYVGPVAEEEKPALFSQSDLFVLPSTADTSSIAVLEAMASGVPCVVSNIGGPATIIQDGRTGRVVPLEQGGALAGALEQLLGDEAGRRTLGRRARRWVEGEASIESTARRFISLYDLLLQERGNGRGARDAG